jgi:hypothetical protein
MLGLTRHDKNLSRNQRYGRIIGEDVGFKCGQGIVMDHRIKKG